LSCAEKPDQKKPLCLNSDNTEVVLALLLQYPAKCEKLPR
jgi:hypothetical protein